MKKYLGLFVALALVLFINAQVTFAEDGENSTAGIQTQDDLKVNIGSIRAEAKIKMDALKVNIKNERNSTKAKMEGLRIAGRENMLERFDAVVEKITNLNNRVVAQIATLGAKGVDVTSAMTFEATVTTKLVDVKAKIAEANTLLSASSDELTADNKATLRTLAKDIQTLLNDAHTALNSAIKSLRDGIRVKMDASLHSDSQNNTNGETND